MPGEGPALPGRLTVVYLDVDDEITSAAARIRAAAETRIVLVLPAGSRLATSRINFRLLAREAEARSRRICVVAPEAATRALAGSAGIAAYATLRDLEAAPEPFADSVGAAAAVDFVANRVAGDDLAGSFDDGPGSRDRGASRQADGGSRQAGERPVRGRSVGGRSAAADIPVAAGARRGVGGGGFGRRAVGVALLLLAIVGGLLGSLYLPAATIVVTPRAEPIVPLTFSIRADPSATAPDAVRRVVPAPVATFPLSVSGNYPATGKKVTDTKAAGAVTFSNIDPFGQHTIAAGSVVSTADGIGFATSRVVILNPAQLVSSGGNIIIEPTTGDTPVTAVAGGTDGNVGAGAIKVPPASQNPRKVHVTNRAPTSGGTHTETLVVAQKDIDAATSDLTKQLADQLDAIVANPAPPLPGTTVFPETKAFTTPVPAGDPATLVGQEVDSFSYGLTATGSVTAVDVSAVQAIAMASLRASAEAGYVLVEDSLAVTVGDGRLQDGQIVFPVRATADQTRTIVASDLVAAVKGRSPADARAILGQYGAVTIELWPPFVDRIPTNDSRIDLSIKPAVLPGGTSVSPAPGGGPASSPVP
jgi:hypothetical protein